ncbi:MAG TPA: Arm DNA-binding domain-containing protein, partial [Caulobacteraceae bacterium]|nr:Arm DNA-binding domain-containing protein [Caulobacteraceae bacterium]
MAKLVKSKERLSAVEVASFAERKEPVSKLYHDGGGLYLFVDKRSHAASWVFRYTLDGKARTMGLGSFPNVGLAKARKRAEDARRVKSDNVDPVAARKKEKAAKRLAQATAMTFKE